MAGSFELAEPTKSSCEGFPQPVCKAVVNRNQDVSRRDLNLLFNERNLVAQTLPSWFGEQLALSRMRALEGRLHDFLCRQ